MKNLVIVESPAKAKTIKKYLGPDFEVLASYGHVRDLKPKKGSVKPDENFLMTYEVVEKNAKHVTAISSALKKATTLYLATDPDREGEAIAWHVLELMRSKKLLAKKTIHRVAFHEITQKAVSEAILHPRELAMDLVNAQQARRALDYLVGFNLSPLLWKKVRRGLSAGRVQSPALRLIVEREEEIEKFITREYWTMSAAVQKETDKKSAAFATRLIQYAEKKLEQFSFTDEQTIKQAEALIAKDAAGKLHVIAVSKKQRKRQPSPPFTTSTLQQEAARKLGFTARKTMQIAQQLYEGVDVGLGTVGLITYMRTDSLNLSQDAVSEMRQYIEKVFGAMSLPKDARFYKTKAKNAQEAHEAIRPTSVFQTPTQLKAHLNNDQYKLYHLIWQRTLACQMIHALLDTVAVDLACSPTNLAHLFRANGSTLVHPGFMALYLEGLDDGQVNEDEERHLPECKVGDIVVLEKLQCEQHFTEPPPRYSEATLVKALEEFGIGRPSTYASIIQTLQQRAYVTLEQKRFIPSDVGRIVNHFLTDHFTRYVDYRFTANLEDELDAISRGEKEWTPVMHEFWQPFIAQIETIDATVNRQDVTSEATDKVCPKCNSPVVIRLGKKGRFLGCTAYPECDYTANLEGDEGEAGQSTAPELIPDRTCPKCESPLYIRQGRYGRFIGCSKYPKCKFIEPLDKPADTGIECPTCHQGPLVEKKSKRFNKTFYGCSRYPDCNYAIWNPPINEPCPKCEWPILTFKETKRRGKEKVCPQKECGFAEAIVDVDEE